MHVITFVNNRNQTVTLPLKSPFPAVAQREADKLAKKHGVAAYAVESIPEKRD